MQADSISRLYLSTITPTINTYNKLLNSFKNGYLDLFESPETMSIKSNDNNAIPSPIIVPKHMISRLLYPNPVCLLTLNGSAGVTDQGMTPPVQEEEVSVSIAPPSCVPATNQPSALKAPAVVPTQPVVTEEKTSRPLNNTQQLFPTRNVMTITWLTPTSNNGEFILSMNKRRYSTELILQAQRFVLNIPVAGFEEKILEIGGCSGRDGDKFNKLNLQICKPGWHSFEGTGRIERDIKRQHNTGATPSNNPYNANNQHNHNQRRTHKRSKVKKKKSSVTDKMVQELFSCLFF